MKKIVLAVGLAAIALPLCAIAQSTSGAIGSDPKKAEETKISDVQPEGRGFTWGGKKYTVSGSRTDVMIGGKQASREQLKSGMSCKVVTGKGDEASKVDCK